VLDSRSSSIPLLPEGRGIAGAGVSIRWLMWLTIVLAPFAAGPRLPGFGNFGSNLALIPFLVCLAFFLPRVRQGRAALRESAYRSMLLSLLALFAWAALLTVANGVRWSLDSSLLGHGAVQASLAKATAPLFIATLIWGGFELGRRLSPAYLENAVRFSFAVFIAYTVLQVASAAIPNPVYSLLWPLFEADTSTNSGRAYFAQFHRVNGPAIEPAEFARVLAIFFAPWLIISERRGAGVLAFGVLIAGCFASLSFVGLYCAALLGLCVLLFSRRPLLPLLIALAGFLALLPFSFWILQERLIDRLFEVDLSTLIRTRYASISLELLLEHPLIGIGWSMEPLFFPDRLQGLLWIPEVLRDIETVNGLAAKSMLLRLTLYTGLPAMMVFLATVARQVYRQYASAQAFPLHSRVAMVLLLVLAVGIVDGGILTTFYPWLAIGLAIGNASAHRKYKEEAAA
jgi:hypothetical protein